MGLDMYLFSTEKIDDFDVNAYEEAENQIQNHKTLVDVRIQPRTKHVNEVFSYQTIFDEVGYWRKANAIHNWFVGNVQNGIDECQYAVVSQAQLALLMNLVALVLQDHSLASKLLPTQNGFFFGGTDYDEWYFEKLSDTRGILERVLLETKWDEQIVFYHSSW